MLRVLFVFSCCLVFGSPLWAAENTNSEASTETAGIGTAEESSADDAADSGGESGEELAPILETASESDVSEAAVEAESAKEPASTPETESEPDVSEAATISEPPVEAVVVSTESVESSVNLSGHLRVGYSTLTPNRFLLLQSGSSDGNAPYVGRNDGFSLGDARLNIRAKHGERLYLRLGFDGALVQNTDETNPIGDLSTGLKDAYLGYVFGSSTALTVGRFKPPFDTEGLLSTSDQLFVHRSLESRGVACHEGRCEGADGMSPGRQLGVMVRDNFLVALGPVDVGYAVALTNGNPGDASLNDNDLLAMYGRMMFVWGEARYQQGDEEGPGGYVRVRDGGIFGVGMSLNDVTYGNPPNRSQDRELGMGMDLAVGMMGVSVQGQLLVIAKNHLQATVGANEREVGGHLQVGYEVLEGLEIGARLASYNPRQVVDSTTGNDQADYDLASHLTVGARYAVPSLPLLLFGEFTHSQEDQADQLNNDRLEFAAQVTF